MIIASFPKEFAEEAIIYLDRRWRNIERPYYTRAEARIDAENDAQ
jgi:hypothetical protein